MLLPVKRTLTGVEFAVSMGVCLAHLIIFCFFTESPIQKQKSREDVIPHICRTDRVPLNSSNRDDLIIVPAYKDHPTIYTSLFYLLTSGYRGKIVLFTVAELKNSIIRSLGEKVSHNIELNVPIKDQTISEAFKVYLDTFRYISDTGFSCNRIVIMDPRRIIFFDDPFSIFYNHNRIYGLRHQNDGVLFKDEDCLEPPKEWEDVIYDTAALAGGYQMMKRFLNFFIRDPDFVKCKSTNYFTQMLTRVGTNREFGKTRIRFIGIDTKPSGVSTDDGPLFTAEPRSFPPAILDWDKSNGALTRLNSLCEF